MRVLRTSHGTDLELRDMFSGVDGIPRPSLASNGWTYSGRRVDHTAATGIPALMAGIRLIADTLACLPVDILTTDDDGYLTPSPWMPQKDLIGREPNETQTAFQVWSHAYCALLGWGNAYLLKAKDSKGAVQALYPLDPSRVEPRMEIVDQRTRHAELVFYVRNVGPNTLGDLASAQRLTRNEVLHIPGQLLNHPLVGVSPISVHRQSLGNALAQIEFHGRYFSNDGTPGGVVSVPGSMTKEKIEELREGFEARHRGLNASHRTAVLTGGATYDPTSVNLKDAAFVEGAQHTVQEIARMLGIPAGLLDAESFGSRSTPEEDMLRFKLRLTPWARRVESALEADKDLFPDPDLPGEPDSDPIVRFDMNQLVRADLEKRYAAYTAARQGGWLSANEIRAQENLPPVEGGDQIQVTPVGGAPNPDAMPASAEPAEAEPADPIANEA